MTEIKQEIKIETPVEKVFGYASNYRNWPAFFEGISDVRPVTRITDDNGSRFIYRVKMMGLKVTVGTEFREFRKNEGWTGISFKGLEAQTQWIFEKSGEGTLFTYIQKYKLPFYLGGRLLDQKVIKPQWIKLIADSLKNLKRQAEALHSQGPNLQG
jgi:uncharacterized membrane protein